MTHLPKSASPSEPQPELCPECNRPAQDHFGVAMEFCPKATEPRRDEREAFEKCVRELFPITAEELLNSWNGEAYEERRVKVWWTWWKLARASAAIKIAHILEDAMTSQGLNDEEKNVRVAQFSERVDAVMHTERENWRIGLQNMENSVAEYLLRAEAAEEKLAELAARASAAPLLDMASKFDVEGEGHELVTVERRSRGWHFATGKGKVVDGADHWSINRSGFCFNRDHEWEYEPLPSGREEEFIQRTRWNSAKEAIEFYRGTSLPQPSAGQWIKIEDGLPEPMQEVDIVVVRTSAGEFVDQWSQIAWRRPDGLWIDDEDIVERKTRHDKMDRRIITHWAKRPELPVAPSAGQPSDWIVACEELRPENHELGGSYKVTMHSGKVWFTTDKPGEPSPGPDGGT